MAKLAAQRKFQGSAFEDWLDAPPQQGLQNALDEAIAFFDMPGGEGAPRAIEVLHGFILKKYIMTPSTRTDVLIRMCKEMHVSFEVFPK